MAELTPLRFIPGTSPVHQIDARFKIILLILLSLIGLKLFFWGLGILTALLIMILGCARLPVRSGLKELRHFLILLLFVFVARALSTDGPAAIDLKIITVSGQGLIQGAIVCWRLALIVMLGLAFIATTRPSEIKAAIQWFLRPIPLISEQTVATMLSLIMRFIPVIFDQARETAMAQKARGVENRKNPVDRLIQLGIPLIRRTFGNAQDLAVAMEARCFTPNRTDPELKCRRRDWLALITIGLVCLALFLFDSTVHHY
jgi:energy-coupling factor transporter transmembrane protein EcfT